MKTIYNRKMNFRRSLALLLIFFISAPFVYAQTTDQAKSSSNSVTVDLLWQGNGYVPGFYKGRSLWGKQGQITFVAIPHTGSINSNSLTYRWTKDGVILGSASGIGKNFLTLADSIISKPIEVQVEILSNQNTIIATNAVALVPTTQQILVYENHPLYGVLFNKEIETNFIAPQKEFSFVAVPLFFSTLSKFAPSIKYNWKVDGGVSQVTPQVTYRAPDTQSGQSQLTVGVQRQDKLLQSVEKSFTVQFGNTPSI